VHSGLVVSIQRKFAVRLGSGHAASYAGRGVKGGRRIHCQGRYEGGRVALLDGSQHSQRLRFSDAQQCVRLGRLRQIVV
jgi:hypothetical protein